MKNFKVLVKDYLGKETEHLFEVRDYPTSGPDKGFYSKCPEFGCSKTYRTEKGSILGMLHEHACTALKIEEVL